MPNGKQNTTWNEVRSHFIRAEILASEVMGLLQPVCLADWDARNRLAQARLEIVEGLEALEALCNVTNVMLRAKGGVA